MPPYGAYERKLAVPLPIRTIGRAGVSKARPSLSP
jgi:hypothetical protein